VGGAGLRARTARQHLGLCQPLLPAVFDPEVGVAGRDVQHESAFPLERDFMDELRAENSTAQAHVLQNLRIALRGRDQLASGEFVRPQAQVIDRLR
jgi:hypothetical protein